MAKKKLTLKQFIKEQKKAYKLIDGNDELDEILLKQHYATYLENEEWKY